MLPGDELVLLRHKATRFGFFVPGTRVVLLVDDTATDGTILVCVDRGFHPADLCHIERVDARDVMPAEAISS